MKQGLSVQQQTKPIKLEFPHRFSVSCPTQLIIVFGLLYLYAPKYGSRILNAVVACYV